MPGKKKPAQKSEKAPNKRYGSAAELADDLARVVTPESIAEDESRRLLKALDEFLEHEETRVLAAHDGRFPYNSSVRCR